ncbi:peptide/nickel transport system ATP-binding protein [Devosia enhydra]|uniref:Glutathione import ATP-binding protein GsiA n=1 Tax=Devosia enhydra TaxID=665118 RepID=A0A1K2HU66_9HYPH|nr:ATP-binding cassette domain-containing protein [Devosia enhydra]SFZ81900.1 peptide/nickel transport system ATP-binding protein [Devosia enhydra]
MKEGLATDGAEPLLVANSISRRFISGGRRVTALDDVSITLSAGETLGLLGPSGSGKSTLARVITRLIEPDAGEVSFAGQDWLGLKGSALRRQRRLMQMVFQDPLGAFNPRASVLSAITDPLRIHRLAPRGQWRMRANALLDRVQLPASLLDRGIGEISGGQRQRVALARALACEPRLIVLDEAVSALDVSIRGQILDLLVELQRQDGLAYLFVSHDLAVVKAVAHRVAIMDAGRIVETGPTGRVIAQPSSPMARALIAAVPRLHQERPR